MPSASQLLSIPPSQWLRPRTPLSSLTDLSYTPYPVCQKSCSVYLQNIIRTYSSPPHCHQAGVSHHRPFPDYCHSITSLPMPTRAPTLYSQHSSQGNPPKMSVRSCHSSAQNPHFLPSKKVLTMADKALHGQASVTFLTSFSTLPWLNVRRFTGLLVYLQAH